MPTRSNGHPPSASLANGGSGRGVSLSLEKAPTPCLPFSGTANPTSQSYGTCDGFFAVRSTYRAFAVEKGWPQHPFRRVEAKVARVCFLPMPLGTGTGTARALTTAPADAHNVTQSR
jgi:hypothetical protein